MIIPKQAEETASEINGPEIKDIYNTSNKSIIVSKIIIVSKVIKVTKVLVSCLKEIK